MYRKLRVLMSIAYNNSAIDMILTALQGVAFRVDIVIFA